MASTNSYPGLEPRVAALLRYHARRLAASNRRLEQEDVEQELAVHLHLRADRFELGRASRTTYHDRLVRHRAADLARNARVAKRGPASMLSLEDLYPERDGVEVGLEPGHENLADWEDIAALRCDLVRFLAGQPPRLQECCLLLLTHSSLRRLACSAITAPRYTPGSRCCASEAAPPASASILASPTDSAPTE